MKNITSSLLESIFEKIEPSFTIQVESTTDIQAWALILFEMQDDNLIEVLSSIKFNDDGTKIIACNFNGQIYSSEDTGTTWTLEAVTGNAWTSIDMNSDASIVTAVGENSLIYVRA